jgi:hypothetical protein
MLVGAEDNDTINGRGGGDKIAGRAGADVISGNDGDDSICAGTEDDTVHAGVGADVVFGEPGSDMINGGDNGIVGGVVVFDNLVGNEGDDDIFGGNGPDNIWGGANDDVMNGGPSPNDYISGQGGVDIGVGGIGVGPQPNIDGFCDGTTEVWQTAEFVAAFHQSVRWDEAGVISQFADGAGVMEQRGVSGEVDPLLDHFHQRLLGECRGGSSTGPKSAGTTKIVRCGERAVVLGGHTDGPAAANCSTAH